ncbi:MAG: M20/M25/M40 family metallo-hydrolase [Nitrospirales bacterium]|nr:M20/M25/M40 family metallo-hydrolase [Nitrospirales bacterium]
MTPTTLPSDFVSCKRLVDTFVELIKINSPSFHEEEIGALLIRKLEELGCVVEMQRYDRSFNLIARKRGSISDRIPLLLSGHMDTIEPTEGISFSADDKVIRSTGRTVLGADDKSAIAQILEALTVLGERDIPHGDLEIVFTSAEEKGLFGAKNLDFRKIRSRHALALDSGGDIGRIVVAAPTHITYEMRVKGRSAHAGLEPEKGINAIRVAAHIISAIPDGRISPDTTANVGIITAGTATNVVPREAVIHGELRSRNERRLEETKKQLFEVAVAAAKADGAEVFISEKREYSAFAIGREDRFLQLLAGVFRNCGIEPRFVETGGGSDANVFNEHGIATINLSTGMRQVHSCDEHIYVRDLFDGCRVLVQAIADFR